MDGRLQGIAYSLSLLKWDVFATLTYPNPLPRHSLRFGQAFAHLHRVCDILERPYKEVRIALRYELGELRDRPHFHYLLGRLQCSNLHTFIHQAEFDWLRATGGHAEIRLYEPGTDVPAYVDKILGGNLYELNKYRRAGELVLSRSVLKALRHLKATACEPHQRGDCRTNTLGSVESLATVERGGDELPGLTEPSQLVNGRPVLGLACIGKDVSSRPALPVKPVTWAETSGGIYRCSTD